MSDVSAGRHVAALRRWLPYALTVVVVTMLLVGFLVVATHRDAEDAPPAGPADAGGADVGVPADAPGLVPEVREHIDGLRPRGRDPADALRRRLDAAGEPADDSAGTP